MLNGRGLSGPAVGPRPRLALSEVDATALVNQRMSAIHAAPHKIAARIRYDILNEDYAYLIYERIEAAHDNKELIEDLGKFVNLSTNLGLDIANGVCVVWKHDARRYVPGATEDENEALRELVLETGFQTHAPSWNKEAYFIGPTTVVPVLRGARMTFDTLLPHFYDTVDNPDDLWGAPLAAMWRVLPDINAAFKTPSIFADESNTAAIVLDDDAWHYYAEETHSRFTPIGVARHGLGEFPGATLSFERPHGAGRWTCNQHQRLVDATITISYLDACLDLVRKGQNQKILALIGDLSRLPRGQAKHPDRGIALNTGTSGSEDTRIEAVDLNTDPEYAIKHQQWKMKAIARSYGGQVTSGASGNSQLESEIQFTHDALTEQRNQQIPFARDFERELWAKTVRVAKRQGHRLAARLPDPDEIRRSLIVDFPPLSRRFENIDAEIKWKNWALSKGLITFADCIRQTMPGASDQQLHDRVAANLKSQGPLIELMTKRDQSMAPTSDDQAPANKTMSQLNGEQGPRVRDANKERDDDDDAKRE